MNLSAMHQSIISSSAASHVSAYDIFNLPLVAIVLGAFFLIVTIDAYRSGNARASAVGLGLILASYVSQELLKAAFIGSYLGKLAMPYAQAGLFLVLAAAMIVVAHRVAYSFEGSARNFPLSILAGISSMIIVVTVWAQTAALQALFPASSTVLSVFGPAYAFYWLVASLLLLAFVQS